MAHYFVAAFTASVLGGVYLKFWKFKYWSRLGLQALEGSLPFGFANRFIFGSAVVSDEFKTLYETFKSEERRHGGAYIWSTPVYIPIDPVIVKTVLEHKTFAQRNIYCNSTKDALFNKLYYSGHEQAAPCRETLASIFSKQNQELYFRSLEQVLDGSLDVSGTEDVTKLLTTLNGTIVKALFLNNTIDDKLLLKNLDKLAESQDYFATKSVLALISSSILKLFFARISNRSAMNYFTEQIQNTVDYKRENPGQEFVDVLMQINDDVEVVSNIVMLILGNCKFVPSTVGFCLYELAKNEDVQRKLRNEIMVALEQNKGELSLETLNSLEYLDQVVKETLRKYPTVSIVKRSNLDSFAVPSSTVLISENTDVIVPISGLHYDSEYYQNPERFDPERFSKEQIQKIQDYTYIPYGSGTRSCVGKVLADVLLKLVVVKFVTLYQMSLPNPDSKVEFLPNCLYTRAKELKVNFQKI